MIFNTYVGILNSLNISRFFTFFSSQFHRRREIIPRSRHLILARLVSSSGYSQFCDSISPFTLSAGREGSNCDIFLKFGSITAYFAESMEEVIDLGFTPSPPDATRRRSVQTKLCFGIPKSDGENAKEIGEIEAGKVEKSPKKRRGRPKSKAESSIQVNFLILRTDFRDLWVNLGCSPFCGKNWGRKGENSLKDKRMKVDLTQSSLYLVPKVHYLRCTSVE